MSSLPWVALNIGFAEIIKTETNKSRIMNYMTDDSKLNCKRVVRVQSRLLRRAAEYGTGCTVDILCLGTCDLWAKRLRYFSDRGEARRARNKSLKTHYGVNYKSHICIRSGFCVT